MSQPLLNEDDLGVPRGTFDGRQIGPKLDAALAKDQEWKMENRDGWKLLRRAWRGTLCFIFGLLIGAGAMGWYSSTKPREYMYGIASGLSLIFLYYGLHWCIKRLRHFGWCCWCAIRSLIWRK